MVASLDSRLSKLEQRHGDDGDEPVRVIVVTMYPGEQAPPDELLAKAEARARLLRQPVWVETRDDGVSWFIWPNEDDTQ